MKSPNHSVASLTLATFIHCNLAVAWVPVDTSPNQPIITPSAIPLYQNYGNSSEVYYIYFVPGNRELLWRIVKDDNGEEVYSKKLPDYVQTVSASTFKDSRVYIAGMTADERWFISALDHFGNLIWVKQGSDEDKKRYPKDLAISKLEFSEDSKELHVKGNFLGVPFTFALNSNDGDEVTLNPRRVSRKLLQSGEMPSSEASDDLFPSPEEKARVVIIDWLLGLIGGIGGTIGFIGAGYGLYQFKKGLNEEKIARVAEEKERVNQQWKNERARRSKEKDFLARLKKHKHHHQTCCLFKPSEFDNPFAPLLDSSSSGIPIAAIPMKLDEINKVEKALWDAMGEHDVSNAIRLQQKKLNQMLAREQLETALFNALQVGDLDEIKKILTIDRSLINSTDSNGNTPLHYAALGSISLLRYLVENGAIVNVINNQGFSPLLLSANSSNPSHIQNFNYLIKIQAHISDEDLSALFHLVTQVPLGHNIHLRTMFGLGLHHRLRLCPIPSCGPVISSGLHNSQSSGGLTILHEAVIAGNIEQIEIILSQGIDNLNVNALDSYENTPLHYAVSQDSSQGLQIIELLINQPNVDINAPNRNGNTPLHNAVLRGNLEVLKKLLSHTSLLRNIANEQGLSPLFLTFRCTSDIEIARSILDQSSMTNSCGQTVLHVIALMPGWSELIDDVLRLGVDINAQDNQGHTALQLAMDHDNTEVVNVLTSKVGNTVQDESFNPQIMETDFP